MNDGARPRIAVDPRDPSFFADPYPTYRRWRQTSPVFRWEPYGHWCFTRHADVSLLLRDRRFGRQILHATTREGLGWPEPAEHLEPFNALERNSLLELEPPEHTRLRGLVNRAFVSRNVERLEPKVAGMAHALIDAFQADRAADLITAFATPIPVTIIAELIGAPLESMPHLLDWSHRMVAMYQFGVTRAIEDSAAAAARDFADFVRACVAERRKAPREDLISKLIEAETEGGKLSEDELIATCVLLLNAGHEATVHAIGNGLKAILERDLGGYVAGVDEASAELLVGELLRFDAPLHMFTRYALEDLEFAGVSLRKGDRVGLLLGAANRDPDVFSQPDQFDPRRSVNPHVSFGAGIHFCVGAPLARLEMRVALPILFQRLPGLRIAETPRYRDAFHFHGLEALQVQW